MGGDALIIPSVTNGAQYLIIAAPGGPFNGSFVILAELSSTRQNHTIALDNGLGMYGALTGSASDQYWYYTIEVEGDSTIPQSLTVTLSIMYGQPAVYVDTVAPASNTSSITTYGSVNPYVTVSATAGATYHIAVYASQPAAFFVTAAYLPSSTTPGEPVTTGSQRLRAGVPFPGTVSQASQPAYFNLLYNVTAGGSAAIVFTLDITTQSAHPHTAPLTVRPACVLNVQHVALIALLCWLALYRCQWW